MGRGRARVLGPVGNAYDVPRVWRDSFLLSFDLVGHNAQAARGQPPYQHTLASWGSKHIYIYI